MWISEQAHGQGSAPNACERFVGCPFRSGGIFIAVLAIFLPLSI